MTHSLSNLRLCGAVQGAVVGAFVVGLFAAPAAAQDAGVQDASAGPSNGRDAGSTPASATTADASTTENTAQSANAITPPALISRAVPVYPANTDGRRVDVEMLLTVDETGRVAQTEVLGHVPADASVAFDDAARRATEQLRFQPARRNGVAIAVRLRFHLPIMPPMVSMDAGVGGAQEIPELPEEGAGVEGITHSHTVIHAHSPNEPREPRETRGVDADQSAPTAQRRPRSGVPAAPASSSSDNESVARVRGQSATPARGAGEFTVAITAPLRQVPRSNATAILQLAPGILLTNEGGEGHSEQVFLRGFDAHEGQDLEFTVNGMPINEVGNPHGEGLVDTHFILPELVRSVRVLEGPFDPHQGNYAVAGSADYELGLDQRGLTVQYSGGSFNTHRLLALWAPDESRSTTGRTFAGADLRTTDGFGQNRSARLGRAMAQWELRLSPTTTLRLLASTYATQYSSAGVLRRDDVSAGRVDFFGTYDATQGGDSMRHTVSASLEDNAPGRVAKFQLFGGLRNFRLRENYTGFVEDPPAAFRSGITQRGDLVDKNATTQTVGARASLRLSTQWQGFTQAIEAGFYGRFDHVDSSQRRLRAMSLTPYRIDFDLEHAVGNVGMYIDTEFRPVRWFAVRGGLRGDYFAFNVLSRCDLHDTILPGGTTPLDELCYQRDRTGARDPSTRRSAGAIAIQPRAALLFGPWNAFSFTASVGTGARSSDPTYIADSSFAPFTNLIATEGGMIYHKPLNGNSSVTVRAMYYFTYVGRDLIFNQQAGRNTLSPGTIRQGMIAAARFMHRWLDWAGSITYADARFVRDAMDPGSTYFPSDQGSMVPYVPSLVARSDLGWSQTLYFLRICDSPIRGHAGLGVTYVAPRNLPYSQVSDSMFVVDASVSAGWRWIELGVSAQNLFNSHYELGVYNYLSNFNQTSTTPDMLPARHFTAGAPLSVMASLSLHFGGQPPSEDSHYPMPIEVEPQPTPSAQPTQVSTVPVNAR